MDTNDKKKKLTKLGNLVFIGIIMFVFLVGLTRTVFFPRISTLMKTGTAIKSARRLSALF